MSKFSFSSIYYSIFTLYALLPGVHSVLTYYLYDVSQHSLFPMEFGMVPSMWKHGSDVKVLVHGWHPEPGDVLMTQNMLVLARGKIVTEVSCAFGQYNPSLNIIVMDWTYYAQTLPTHYAIAAQNTYTAAVEIADFLLRFLNYAFSDFGMVHCLGFSLGAHVCGALGYVIQQATMGEQLGRITGLDPAGPGFTPKFGHWPSAKHLPRILDYSDAEFVDIIHTNMGVGSIASVLVTGALGSNLQAGHMDFYPNGGERQIYHCNPFLDRVEFCSHKMVVLFYASSLRYPMRYLACPCGSYTNFVYGLCPCHMDNGGIFLGEFAYNSGRGGRYYLKITSPV